MKSWQLGTPAWRGLIAVFIFLSAIFLSLPFGPHVPLNARAMPSKIQPLLPSGPRPNLASVSPADCLPRSSRVDSSEIKVQVARGFRVAKDVVIPAERIERSILLVRGQKVMLDSDLAELYGVPAKRLNEQVKRNQRRFPDDFMFQLNTEEAAALRSQFATLKPGRGQHRKYMAPPPVAKRRRIGFAADLDEAPRARITEKSKRRRRRTLTG